ncbi:MAG TPA: diguanylate cyclase, partial [Pilimelia sp.]|nr:diguanylate cyclase [Pilimelia sp.]
MSARVALTAYAGWMALLTAGFFALPAGQMLIWAAIGLSSAAAIVLGTRRHRPRRAGPWLSMAVGVVLFAAGDTAYNVLTEFLGQQNPFPSVADVLYLAMFPFVAGGLVALARSGVSGRDRASLIDALTLSLGAFLLSWIFLIEPYLASPDLTVVERLVSIAYPIWDVLFLATVARLVVAARQTPAVALLAVGTAALLIADVGYGLSQLGGTWQVGGALDLGWIAFYTAWGAAALHPSMARLTEPRVVRQNEISLRRLALLALSSLIAPAVLLVEALGGPVRDGVMIAVLSAVMFLLVLTRLAGVVSIHRQALVRERALRRAAAELVAAADADQVSEALRSAVGRLMPPDTPHRVVVEVRGRGSGAGGHPGASSAAWARPPAEPAGGDRVPAPPRAPADDRAPEPSRAPADGRGPDGAGPPAPLVPREQLPRRLAARLGDFATVLRLPLVPASGGDARSTGELIVAAPDSALVTLQGTLEVLASQAALALERTALTEEVNRRIGEEYFRTLVHSSTDVILILGEHDKIRYASPSAQTVLGHQALVGVPLPALVAVSEEERVRDTLHAVRAGGHGVECADWTVVQADGTLAQVEVSCRDLRRDPTVDGLVVTMRDVTERRRLEAELTHRALHDSLTGLANRVLFHDRTNRAITRSQRTGTLIGVLFIDLDDFKVVNDTLGHQMGDELLLAVGQRLTGVLREHDTAARLGGDEFAILVEDATHPADVEAVAARVLAALSVPIAVGGELLSGHASIGVAIGGDASDAAELLRQADLALYLAKSEGKNQWRRYETTLHAALLERLELRAALERAVAERAFTLYYQPIVELANDAPVGAEALVRWVHPTRGMIPPGQFIEVAEETGLIVPIGSWVLRTAVGTAARWRREFPERAPYVSVNVSARQFRSPGFVDEVRAALSDA